MQKSIEAEIPCFIYKLNMRDSLIYTSNSDYQRNILIMQGAVLVLKIFTNREIIPMSILNDHSIIFIKNYSFDIENYYYKAVALKETYMISLKMDDISSQIIHRYFIKAFYNTIRKQILIAQILLHKEANNRTLQIIIYLSEYFGYLKNNDIIVDLQINYNLLALMTATNTKNMRKIINKLKNRIIIKSNKNKIIYITQYRTSK